MNVPVLFENPNDCCACGACLNACPQKAISMRLNELGTLYPTVDGSLCVGCQLCKTVCDFQDEIVPQNLPIKVYAAQSQNTDLLKSASGGVFASVASDFISQNGITYGAALEIGNGITACSYKEANDNAELEALCGSKYVHANTHRIYGDVKAKLDRGEKILFSGTPCQVAGLKSFLKKEYNELYTMDIVCHGIPEEKWFVDYINTLEEKKGITIGNIVFRDKKRGWGVYTGRLDYITKKGKNRSRFFISRDSSYYYYFLSCNSFRESCYSCKYATNKRVGDLTIGDFWGVETEHPDEIKSSEIDVSLGVSCIMVNTEKGDRLLADHGSNLNLFETKYEKVYKNNEQLLRPSIPGKDRKDLLRLYKESGYASIDSYFKKKMRVKVFLYRIYAFFHNR